MSAPDTAEAWASRDRLGIFARDLALMAERLADMAYRGQDRLALAAALDIRGEAGRAVEIARKLAESAE